MTDPTEHSRLRRPLSTSGWLLLVVLVVFGFGFVASRAPSPADTGPPPPDVAAARAAIDALVHPGTRPDALAKLPADFTAYTGIRPGALAARDGTVRAVHVDGGCSTPWGDDNTKWDYSAACKSHDLGYDLLRYSASKGHPLAPDAREALDDRLSADMHAMCHINPMNSPGTCQVVASLYSAGLVVNSWHQRWGPPVGDPIGPMLAGVAVIGCLLVLRLRGWLHTRRTGPAPLPPPETGVDRWSVLAVASIGLIVVGESSVALAHWAGVGKGWLWPVTWLAQLAPLFFFAGGHSNAAGWRKAGGYREYLAHRASWLLRPALIFVVVTLVLPLAMELLDIPRGTTSTVLRIALHPLWLLGVYLLTVIATPPLLKVNQRAATLSLLGLVILGELTASWLGSPLPRYAAALGLALLAQQLAFARTRPSRLLLGGAVAVGLGGLVTAGVVNGGPLTLLGSPGSPPALAAPAWAVLLLGLAQFGLLGLFARPLARLGRRPEILRATRLALRAPMSLYLVFLAAMLLLIAIVYLPGRMEWLVKPRTLFALLLVAGPAALVFWWFEQHGRRARAPRPTDPPGRLTALLARSAVVVGLVYATLGVFGFALSVSAQASLLGLRLDPIQSLIHLLLGVFLLHTVRIGTSAAATTWLICGLACAPSLLAAADGDVHDLVGPLLHGATAAFAVLAMFWGVLNRAKYATRP
ncbi:phospholipase A2 [Amycolatopsis sp. NPDC059657]|uniref:phospholipase A2 n=1 Tax=Amycolatopsis sp. NPDC059657 TaxID=3346899 RepID=UPI00366C0D0F